MIPFFVVDRPVSLEILKGVFLEFPDLKFGLMTHANVSTNFIQIFKEFPHKTSLKYLDNEGHEINEDTLNKQLKNNIIKMADSGAFQKNGSIKPYQQLFNTYLSLGVHFGIINDVLHDMNATIESAKEAIDIYDKLELHDRFNLIGVAQGKTTEEYVKCYSQLLDLGYEYIAIGGLLKRNGNSNYVQVKSEKFLKDVVTAIQNEFSPEWLFVLGVYNPRRHALLNELGVWGADYKGWLFHYDEYYSRSIQEFLRYPDVKKAYNKFLHYKNKFRSNRTRENRTLFWHSRKELDSVLRSHGSSLQRLRFQEVRNSIKATIIPQMKN